MYPPIFFQIKRSMNFERKILIFFFLFLLSTGGTPVFSQTPTAAFTFSNLCTKPNTSFVDISTTPNVAITNWLWNFGDPGSGVNNTSATDNPFHQFSTPGNYTVTLTVTDDTDSTNTTSQSLTILPSGTANFSFVEACDGLPIQFTDLSTGPAPDSVVAWLWDFGDLTTGSIKNPSKIYGAANTYNVKLTSTASNGCPDMKTLPVKVHAIPVPEITAIADACLNSPIYFQGLAFVYQGTAASWLWSFGASGTDSNQNPQFAFSNTGFYPIVLAVTSEAGCVGSDTVGVEVHSLPVSSFTLSPLIGYPPLTVNFSNTSSDGNFYHWDFGDGQILESDSITISHVFVNTGDYTTCMVTADFFQCADTVCHDVQVKSPSTDLAIISIQSPETGSALGVSVLLANYGNTIITKADLVADIGSGSILEKWTGNLKPGKDTTYFFKASFIVGRTLNDAFACVEAIDPNGYPDDVPSNNKQCRSIGGEFHVSDPFPNPSHQNIEVEFILPESGKLEVNLYDLLGRKIKSFFNENAASGLNILNFELSGIGNGIYTLRSEFESTRVVKPLIRY